MSVIGEGILWRTLIGVRNAQVLVDAFAAEYQIICKWGCISLTECNTGKTRKVPIINDIK
jgi:hypothetical protein